MMKKCFSLVLCFLLLFPALNASACSLLFIGGDYTDDGASLFVRVEDGDLNDENKLYLVSPAGKHKAGEEYHSFDFVWVFTHDSYRHGFSAGTAANLSDRLPGKQGNASLPVLSGCGAGTGHGGMGFNGQQPV